MVNLTQKDIIDAADTTKLLVQDDEYYRYIFKKTEKVVSVVFYILYNLPRSEKTLVYIEDIQRTAQRAHDAILTSLEVRTIAAEDAVRSAALALISLGSKLQVARTAGVLTNDLGHMLTAEIDTILRGMNRYTGPHSGPFLDDDTTAPAFGEEPPRRRPRPVRSAPVGEGTTEDVGSRRERIRTVLAARGQASIKDISDVITDVSEKTIQRELNAMIEDSVVERHGERRWSVYTLKTS